jgi:hypothetical protein
MVVERGLEVGKKRKEKKRNVKRACRPEKEAQQFREKIMNQKAPHSRRI